MSDDNWLTLFRYASFIGGLIVALSTVGVTVYQSRTDKVKDQKIDSLVTGKDELLKKNDDLSNQINRYQNDLQLKDAKIKELEIQAKKSSRGVTSIYDFNGAKRNTVAGSVSVVAGEEIAIFQKMRELDNSKNYTELKNLCEEQKKKTPDWLTPYLYLGVAYANLGEKEKAVSNLEHVISNAPGDPNYAQAEVILKQIKK